MGKHRKKKTHNTAQRATLITLLCMCCMWPIQLSNEEAHAAVNPDSTVSSQRPHVNRTVNSAVEEKFTEGHATVTAVSKGDTWYLGTSQGGIWTRGSGGSWKKTSVAGVTPRRRVLSIAQVPGDSQIVAVAFASRGGQHGETPGRVFLSMDGGRQWFNITNNLPNSTIAQIKFEPNTLQTLSARVGKTWYRASMMGNWKAISTP